MPNLKRGPQHNAIKRGFFANILLSGSDSAELEEFEVVLMEINEAIPPTNGFEEILTGKLAMLLMRLKRVYKADLEIAPKLFARVRDCLNTSILIGSDLEEKIVRTSQDPSLELVVRYETSIERQINRTLSLIQQLRRMREIDIAPISQDTRKAKAEEGSSIVSQNPELHP
jgi:hypothetical protein